jgi:ferredoxin
MKVLVDGARCQGHGRCNIVSPAIFDLDEEGFSVVLVPDVPDDRLTEVQEAVANCPERAIATTV